MIETRVYENNGGGLSAVVRNDGTITGVFAGFEYEQPTTAAFVQAAAEGFPDADPYDPDDWGGLTIEQAAEEIEEGRPEWVEGPELVAVITGGQGSQSVELYTDRMGYAARRLLGVKDDDE